MRTDFLLDENNDLAIENGDFVVGESDQQNVVLICLTQKGEWKEHPEVGFGADNYLKGVRDDNKFKRNLRLQLENDGYNNPTIDLSEGYENLKITV